MSKFRNPRIAALATAATLGVGALAVPSAALAASHASKTKVVKTTKSSSKVRLRHDSQHLAPIHEVESLVGLNAPWWLEPLEAHEFRLEIGGFVRMSWAGSRDGRGVPVARGEERATAEFRPYRDDQGQFERPPGRSVRAGSRCSKRRPGRRWAELPNQPLARRAHVSVFIAP